MSYDYRHRYDGYRSYQNYFKKTRDCSVPSFSNDLHGRTYTSNYGRYYGPLEWFPEAAKNVLEWFLETNREDHQNLYEEVKNGDDLGGFLEIGQKQEGLIKFYVLLCITALLSVLIFLGGVFWNFSRNEQMDSSTGLFCKLRKKGRGKLVPVCLFHIPLLVVLGFLLALFSMNLWFLYFGIIERYDPADRALQGARIDLHNMIKLGDCEYKASIVDGADAINREMNDFFAYQLAGCDGNTSLTRYTERIKTDSNALLTLRNSTDSIVLQIQEMQEVVIEVEERARFAKIAKTLANLRDGLDSVYKSFGKEIENSKEVLLKRRVVIDGLYNKLAQVSEPTRLSLQQIESRVKTVIDTFHNSVAAETNWIEVVGQRMKKMKDHVRKKGDPLTAFVSAQLNIAIPILFAMFSLVVSFLAVAVKIVYPKALTTFPRANLKARRFITASFYLQCFLVGFIALITWFTLSYSASLTMVCTPMYSAHNNSMSSFYKDIGDTYLFKDYYGNEEIQTFADSVQLTRDSHFSNMKKLQLIPELSELVDFDAWYLEVQRVFMDNTLNKIHLENHSKIVKDLASVIAQFKKENTVSDVRNSRSQLAKLVAKELQQLEILLPGFYPQSIDTVPVEECNWRSPDDSIKKILQNIFNRSIAHYGSDFYTDLYVGGFIFHSYMGTGEKLCVDWRIPLSGLWLAGTLLSVTLLVSAIVLFKVFRNLHPVRLENASVKTDSTRASTIYAPLIDEDKNPTVEEI